LYTDGGTTDAGCKSKHKCGAAVVEDSADQPIAPGHPDTTG